MKNKPSSPIVIAIIVGFLPYVNNIIILILGLAKKRYGYAFIAASLLVLFSGAMILDSIGIKSGVIPLTGCISMFISMIFAPIAFIQVTSPKPIPILPPKVVQEQKTSPTLPGQDLRDILKTKAPAADLKIRINESLEDQIILLPSISLIEARKIVDERLKNGAFSDITDFQNRVNLSPVVIREIQPHLDFDRAKPQEKAKKTQGRKVDFE